MTSLVQSNPNNNKPHQGPHKPINPKPETKARSSELFRTHPNLGEGEGT